MTPAFDERTLLIATTNKGKVAELAYMLQGMEYRVIGLSSLPDPPPPVEETGTTFEENALLKARYYHEQTGLLTLADDSGLEVDALDGRPGVYSARYGGDDLSEEEQVQLLLRELHDVPEARRTGRYVCCIALAGPRLEQAFTESCEGRIAFAPIGTGGFGYDPVFYDPELGCTFAEISREAKAARSHRGKALRAARQFLETAAPST